MLKLFYFFSAQPRFLEIENTTRCNLKCVICEHSYWSEKNQDMTFSEFKGILEQFPALKFLGLTGIGESLLNKDFLDMLRLVRKRSVSTIIELYDTFYLLDSAISEVLIELSVDHIYLSFDAANKQTYEKIRVGANFERVISNVREFMRLKQQQQAHFPEITIHYIINRLNIHEVADAVKLAKSLGIPRIYFTKLLHPFSRVEELMPPEDLRHVSQEALAAGRRLGVEVIFNPNVAKQKPPIQQCNNWIMPFIFADGSVLPCCAANEANRRQFQREHSFGNVFKESFRDIWFGPKFKQFREMISQGQVPEYCRNCPMYDTETTNAD